MKINFAKYLLELLLEQGKVDVPGLGKFEMERKSASFGDGRQSLNGPRQEIVFKEVHDSNDTQLQDRISNKEGTEVDSVKAGEFVNQFTSDVLKGLMENKEVEIAYIGIIKRNVDEQISFTQNQGTIDKLNKYLPEVDLPEPQKLEPTETESAAKVSPTKKPAEAKPAEAKPAVEKPIVATEKASTIKTDIKPEAIPILEPKKTGMGWIKWVVGIFGLILLSTLLFKMCGKEDPTEYKANQTEGIVEDENIQLASSEETKEQQEDEHIKESTGDDGSQEDSDSNFDEGSVEAETKTAADFNKEQCIVIIGSYQSNKNVRSTSSQIKDKGYNIYTESHGAYTRVGVKMNCDDITGSYSSFVQEISKEFGVNAWFLSPEVKQ